MVGSIPDSYYHLISSDQVFRCQLHDDEWIQLAAISNLPSNFGDFIALAFYQPHDTKEHLAIVKGDIVGKSDVLVRIHSECLTGDALGSLRCDCRQQLAGGLRKIEEEGSGLLIYLRQEGRGIGLTNKIRAYELQDNGYDTFDANHELGFRADERDYTVASHLLNFLGIKSIRLLTNNPEKLIQLQNHGISISGRVEHIYPPNKYNEFYLETKKKVSNHLLDKNMNGDRYIYKPFIHDDESPI